ncbi:MAG: pilus assembly protein [Anaerolineae bacterium]|nr:pilus assembly protein [Anaerolineae bacterium]
MKRLFYRLRLKEQQGQSLVELAITAPILVFMLLGVFEVGWALRGYLVLTNVNREITRFAIRPGYLDYSIKNNTITSATTVGYSEVLSYVYTTLSDQLPLDFSTGQTATLIISHIVADTGLPCALDANGRLPANCDCNRFVTDPNYYINGTNVLTFDDLILHPGLPGYQYFYAYTFPMTSTYRTKINYAAEAAELARQNNKFNCELMKKSGGTLPAANNVIITEMFYNQPQLFGFPIIANPYTNPVPMYAHTAMRMIVASRSGENVDTVGPVCEAYPITFPQSTFGANPGNYPSAAAQDIDIWEGTSPGNFGWITWNPNPSNNNTNYLEDELQYPRMSLNDFTEVADASYGCVSTDHNLSLNDCVSSSTGVMNSNDVRDLLLSLVGKTILIPVFDASLGSGQNTYYHISHFARVQINNFCLSAGGAQCDGQNKNKIDATFLGYDDAACSN